MKVYLLDLTWLQWHDRDVSGFLCPWLQWHERVWCFRFSVSLVTVTWTCLMFGGFLCPWLQWHDRVWYLRFSVSLVTWKWHECVWCFMVSVTLVIVTWACLRFEVFCVPGYSDMIVFHVSVFLWSWLQWHDRDACFRFSVSLVTTECLWKPGLPSTVDGMLTSPRQPKGGPGKPKCTSARPCTERCVLTSLLSWQNGWYGGYRLTDLEGSCILVTQAASANQNVGNKYSARKAPKSNCHSLSTKQVKDYSNRAE